MGRSSMEEMTVSTRITYPQGTHRDHQEGGSIWLQAPTLKLIKAEHPGHFDLGVELLSAKEIQEV